MEDQEITDLGLFKIKKLAQNIFKKWAWKLISILTGSCVLSTLISFLLKSTSFPAKKKTTTTTRMPPYKRKFTVCECDLRYDGHQGGSSCLKNDQCFIPANQAFNNLVLIGSLLSSLTLSISYPFALPPLPIDACHADYTPTQ